MYTVLHVCYLVAKLVVLFITSKKFLQLCITFPANSFVVFKKVCTFAMEMNKSKEEMMRKKFLMIFVGGLLACGYPALAQRSDGKLVKGRLHTVIYQKNGTTAEGSGMEDYINSLSKDSIKDDPFCILKKLDELLSSDKQ